MLLFNKILCIEQTVEVYYIPAYNLLYWMHLELSLILTLLQETTSSRIKILTQKL